MQPGGGGEIEEDQHFLMRLNGPAVEASVVANAWCEVEGIGERLALAASSAATCATQLLKARRIDKAQAERTLIARCERPLPNGAAMRLVWGKGIAAARQSEGRDDDRAALPLHRARAPSRPSSAASASARTRRACRSGR